MEHSILSNGAGGWIVANEHGMRYDKFGSRADALQSAKDPSDGKQINRAG